MRISVIMVALLTAGSLSAQAAKPAAKSTPAAPAASAFSLPPRASGPPNAAVVIEVYSDFECPTCKELYVRTLRLLIPEYCATGKVYLIHHDFPLPQHRYSHLAAVWADAAATVGKYEEVTDAIFSKQEIWTASGNVASVVSGVLSASDFQKVKQTVETHQAEINAAIDADLKMGKALDVKETPTMRVSNHGQVITEKQPGLIAYAILKKYIDQQLSK
jgi:protein-disulfide isomerase